MEITEFVEDQLKNYKLIDMDQLTKADWNYKEEDTEDARYLIEKLKNNIKKNGIIENIHVRKLPTGYYEVVNGNHRYIAAQELGLKKLIAYDHGDIDLDHAKLLAIETNETKFKPDSLKLSQLMVDLMNNLGLDEVLATSPYKEEELMSMKSMLEYDPSSFEGTPSETPKDGLKKEFSIELDEDMYDQLMSELTRIKRLMYQEEDPDDVSNQLPFQAMIQCVIETPDSYFKEK